MARASFQADDACSARQGVDGTVGGDGAEGRRAGRLDSGHGFHPYIHTAQTGGLFLLVGSDSNAAGAKQGKELHSRHAVDA